MTTTNQDIKKMDFRNLELKVGDLLSINGKDQIVSEATLEKYGEGKRLFRFRVVRREEEGIVVSAYSVNQGTGEEHQDFSGIYHEKENPPYGASKMYSQLNEFLAGFGK